MGHAATFSSVVGWTLPVWLFWVPATAVVAALARRFPLERGRFRRGLPVHAAAAVALAMAHLVWWLAWTQWVSPYALTDRDWGEMIWLYVQSRFNVSFLVYWAILGVWNATAYSARWRRSELDASRLEGQLARAQLQVLRSQIQPHFLFNTLHAISSLVSTDPERSRHMIARLSDLLRLALEREADQEIPLRDELEYVEIYLDIMQTRFGDRLRIDFEVDPTVLDAPVPNLVLQPLVENAVRHGIARLEGPGALGISAGRSDGRVEIRVVNDVPAEDAADGEGNGVGLRNVRVRLERLYGSARCLRVGRDREGRFEAILSIPLRAIHGGDGS